MAVNILYVCLFVCQSPPVSVSQPTVGGLRLRAKISRICCCQKTLSRLPRMPQWSRLRSIAARLLWLNSALASIRSWEVCFAAGAGGSKARNVDGEPIIKDPLYASAMQELKAIVHKEESSFSGEKKLARPRNRRRKVLTVVDRSRVGDLRFVYNEGRQQPSGSTSIGSADND